MKYILSVDIGGFSVKAILMDSVGKVVCSVQKSQSPTYPFHSQIELAPEKIFSSVIEVINQVIEESEIKKGDIVGLGIANARGTAIAWDKETKKPLWNAILKNDNRTTDICDSLRLHEGAILEKTGVPLSPYGSATKLKWILENAPGASHENCLFGGLNTWILWKLTKGKAFVTDMSNISKSLLFNIHDQTWDDELIEIFGAHRSMLPEIRSSNEVYGYAEEEFFGCRIPICSMVSDTGGAMFAAGCHKKGEMHLLAGVSAFLLLNTGDTPTKSEHHLMSTVGLSLKDEPPMYCLEGAITSTGGVVEWLESHLGIIRSAKEVEGLAYSVPDSGGVYFVPAISGISSPFQTERVRGSLLGLSPSSNIGHICRAALEGIAFLIRDIYERYKEAEMCPRTRITCSGGMTENIFLVQITSDLMGRSLIRPRDIKLSTIGAAYLAGMTLGIWQDTEEVRGLFSMEREFKPSLKEEDKVAMFRDWKKAMASAMLFSDIKIA